MIPTIHECWDGKEHKWLGGDSKPALVGDAWCKKCGCRGIVGEYLTDMGEAIAGKPGVAFDIDIPTCHTESEGEK